MIDTVTLDLREYLLMRDKAKAIDEMDKNPDTYVVFYVTNHWNLGTSTVFYEAKKDVIDGFMRAIEEQRVIISNLESEIKYLRDQNFALKNKRPWYQFW